MLTFALDSSTNTASAAVANAGQLLDSIEYPSGRGASPAPLSKFLASALQAHGRPARIVVGLGPGSYSGTRIAIATALGLATATGAKLFGLPSALGIEVEFDSFRVFGDARRDTAYHAVISGVRCTTGPELLEKPAVLKLLAEPSSLPVVSPDPPDWLTQFTPANPQASRLALLAQHPEVELIDGTHGLEPIYLRPPNITVPTKSDFRPLADTSGPAKS